MRQRATSLINLPLLTLVGLVFLIGACTDSALDDATDAAAELTDEVTGTTEAEPTTETTEADDETADTAGPPAPIEQPLPTIVVDADGEPIDDVAADDELAMVDVEISEQAAEPPQPEPEPQVDEVGPEDVPQADLGAGESVACAMAQIAFDALIDGDDGVVASQQDRIESFDGTIVDGELAAALDGPLDLLSLGMATDRCVELGYEL